MFFSKDPNQNYSTIMPSFFQHMSWLPIRLAMRIFCSFEIKDIENVIKLKSGFIIASNHISELDPLLISACLPFFSKHLPLYYVSREKDFYDNSWLSFLYGGKFFRLMGAYPAYVGLNDYKKALRHHIQIINQKKNVVIFPTGKKSPDKNPEEAKGGVIFLSQETKSPIVPILIKGIENFSFKSFITKKIKLTIIFGNPIYPKNIFSEKSNDVTDINKNPYEKAASILMSKIFQLS